MNDRDIELNLHKLVKRKTIGKVVLTKDLKKFEQLEKENANLNRENDRLNDELENLKEAYGGENAKLKAELESEKRLTKQIDKHLFDKEKELREAKAEALILDKAFSKACIDIDINEISKGKIITNCIESLNTIKEHYLKEASK